MTSKEDKKYCGFYLGGFGPLWGYIEECDQEKKGLGKRAKVQQSKKEEETKDE